MRSGSYDDILSEYPRPQMRRTDYHMLNGLWEYAFVPADGSSSSEDPAHFTAQGIIRVPFSPEALLSRVHRRLEPTEYLWYHRELSFSTEELSQKEENMHCILHFDAVDQEATVFLGTKQLGIHSGGYLPFSLDITEYVNEDPVSLYVKVRDLTDTGYATRGKQTLNRGALKAVKLNTEVTLYTYLNVREDAVDLFGFATKAELETFKNLISVSGVGPKAGLAVLSELSPEQVAMAIASDDLKTITRAQGIGKKIAQRIVLELKDKLAKAAKEDSSFAQAAQNSVNVSTGNVPKAIEALGVLGYSPSDVSPVLATLDSALPVEQLISLTLKQMGRQ